MRASEEQRQHNDKSMELMDEIQKTQAEFDDLVGDAPIPVVVHGSPEEASLRKWIGARNALDAHNVDQPNPVRSYRVMDIEGSKVLAEFTCDYVRAPVEANKSMLKLEITRYALEEQLPDGRWVAYYASHENREQSS